MLVGNLRAEGWEITYHETLGDDRLPPAEEEALFGVVREILNNLRKHAQTTKVRVSLEPQGRFVRLKVQDFGQGFSPDSVNGTKSIRRHIGLLSMQERVGGLGGRLTIESSVGHGTLIVPGNPYSPALRLARRVADEPAPAAASRRDGGEEEERGRDQHDRSTGRDIQLVRKGRSRPRQPARRTRRRRPSSGRTGR